MHMPVLMCLLLLCAFFMHIAHSVLRKVGLAWYTASGFESRDRAGRLPLVLLKPCLPDSGSPDMLTA